MNAQCELLYLPVTVAILNSFAIQGIAINIASFANDLSVLANGETPITVHNTVHILQP